MAETVYERVLKQMDSEEEESLEENTFHAGDTELCIRDGMADRMSFLLGDIPEEELAGLKEVLFSTANGNVDGALSQIKYTPVHNGARLTQMEAVLRQYAGEHREELATKDMLCMIRKLLLESEVIEEVKLGLFLYEQLFDTICELDEIIMNYAKSGEFAQFSMNLVKRMENGNQKLFELVKESGGCGDLVAAVDLLDPETQEIEDWIFRYGTDPFLSYYYSSVPISKKCNLVKRMKDPNLSDADYYNLCRIIYGYCEEGYADGFETLDNVMEILEAFFELCERRITDFMLFTLENIHEALLDFKKHRNSAIVIPEEEYCREACERILNSESVRTMIIDHVNRGEWIPLGSTIGILTDDRILDAMKEDPFGTILWFEYFKTEAYRKKALDLYLSPEIRNQILGEEAYMPFQMYVLELLREMDVPDEEYFRAMLDEENFFLTARAASALISMDEKGIPVDGELLFRAQNYLYRLDQASCN